MGNQVNTKHRGEKRTSISTGLLMKIDAIFMLNIVTQSIPEHLDLVETHNVRPTKMCYLQYNIILRGGWGGGERRSKGERERSDKWLVKNFCAMRNKQHSLGCSHWLHEINQFRFGQIRSISIIKKIENYLLSNKITVVHSSHKLISVTVLFTS